MYRQEFVYRGLACAFAGLLLFSGCSKPQESKLPEAKPEQAKATVPEFGGSNKSPDSKAESPQSKQQVVRTKPLAIAVSYPLEYLTQRIAGESLEVRCLVPADVAASKWKPNRDEIRTIQSSDVVIANGVGARFAKWLEMASVPPKKVCNSVSQGLSSKDFIEVDSFTHSHGDLGEHSHPIHCPYTWLNPEMARKQARHICDDLTRRFPKNAEQFKSGYDALSADLQILNEEFAKIPQPEQIEHLTVISASYDLKFFSQACHWKDIHLKWPEQPEPEAAATELDALFQTIASQPLVSVGERKLMLSTYPFSEELLKRLESFQIKVVTIDKLDFRPKEGDYLTVMKANIARLIESLGSE